MKTFVALRVGIVTVSHTRTLQTDRSGGWLSQAIADAGHTIVSHVVADDDIAHITTAVNTAISTDRAQVVVTTGGTGYLKGDCTIPAIRQMGLREIPGFGERFRYLSSSDVGDIPAMMSAALAGLLNQVLVVALPGSLGAVKLGWLELLKHAIDNRTQPCNLADVVLSDSD